MSRFPSPDEEKEPQIDLKHIDSETVQKVVEYLTYHDKVPAKPIDAPLCSNNMRDVVDEWDAKYTDMDQDLLFKTLLVSRSPICRHSTLILSCQYS